MKARKKHAEMFLRILFIVRFKRLQKYLGKMSFLFEIERDIEGNEW